MSTQIWGIAYNLTRVIYICRLKTIFTQQFEALLHCCHWEDLWYGDYLLCIYKFFFSLSVRGFGNFSLFPIDWNFMMRCPGGNSFSFVMLTLHWYFWPRDPVLWFLGIFLYYVFDNFFSRAFSAGSFRNCYYLDVGLLNRFSNFLNFSIVLISLIILFYFLRDFLNYMFLLFSWIFYFSIHIFNFQELFLLLWFSFLTILFLFPGFPWYY